jgi:hypothetical protein
MARGNRGLADYMMKPAGRIKAFCAAAFAFPAPSAASFWGEQPCRRTGTKCLQPGFRR